jgi:hypothetical protein
MLDHVHLCEAEGPRLREADGVLDVIAETWGSGATRVVIPAVRLHDDFFVLSTGVAGEIVQKFANYRLSLVIVGDISGFMAASSALRAWVAESNRGEHIWFVRDLEELAARSSAREHSAADIDERGGHPAGPVRGEEGGRGGDLGQAGGAA